MTKDLSLTMFRTAIESQDFPFRIAHHDQMVLIGSCFSENIGQRLAEHKFNCVVNPFGTLFHPKSIFNLLTKDALDEALIIARDGLFLSHELHSDIKAEHADALQHKFSALQAELQHQLKNASLLVLTFGTAFEYNLKSEGQHVANCHKVPQSQFNKTLSSAEEILQIFNPLYSELKSLNPELQILLTVSPVRHTKDTLPLNNVSKSILRTACHLIQASCESAHYFPAYEIMMDDLRDYRFYEKDMIHPNEQALDYIWQRFGEAFFTEETSQLNEQIHKLQRAVRHKAFNAASKNHQQFLKRTLNELEELNTSNWFEKEIGLIKSQIIESP